MTRLKVATIVGTRPEVIKLSRVMAELERHTCHVLIHTGQNYDYELNGVFFEELEIRRPDHFLNAAGATAAETIASVIVRSDEVLRAVRPDAVLIYGDTNSCLAAISAKRLKIPVFHMEAGNRCFDQRVPEEINRKIIDHLSDINLPLTEHARQYLLAEGLRPETVIKTGSPMAEVLEHARPRIESSDAVRRMGLAQHEYFLVSAHREENVDSPDRLRALLSALSALAEEYRLPIVFSTHPRTARRLAELPGGGLHPLVRQSKPFGFVDYIALQRAARCVLSDSGTITEEAALLRFPAVTLRQAHERPEGMDQGVLVMSDLSAERVLQAVRLAVAHAPALAAFDPVPDYQSRHVSQKVVRIIQSYVDFVNRTVWQVQARTPAPATWSEAG